VTLADPAQLTDEIWSPALAGVSAEALDCMQVNLAVVADRTHPGAHVALGAPLRFTLASGPPGQLPPVIEATLDDRLAQAAALLGVRVTARWDSVDGTGLRDLARSHAPLYIVADAYSMAWVPYAGQRHLDHSFLLLSADSRQALVADAYHNNTPWGAARPGIWQITAADLDAAAGNGATAMTLHAGSPPPLDGDAIVAGNAAAMDTALADIDRYIGAVRATIGNRQALGRLVLDVWLLSRSRLLHAAWLASLGDRPAEAAAAAEHAQAWVRLSTVAFVAERRAQRGQAASPAIADQLDALLRADTRLAHQMAAGLAGGPAAAEPRGVVLDELGAITGLDAASLEAGTELRSLPGFSSFRLADLIDRAEQRLGLQLDPDDLTADSLRTVASLCELFVMAAGRASEASS
jgi:acyl carrier protein